MRLDANTWPQDSALHTDLCIVGAGAAGISLALELADSGLDVVLLEAGGLRPERATQDLYAGSVDNLRLHSLPDRYRERRFGGSTTIWGGRCVPFDDIDFEVRDYIPDSGWPIDRATLLPYYEHANRLCEAGDFSYCADDAFARPLRPMIDGFTSAHFSQDSLERFSCPTDFGRRYLPRLQVEPRLRLMLHANVTALHLDPQTELVQSAEVRTLEGRHFNVYAQRFVLAAGGLEVARLLLASRGVQHSGLGNAHDCVGRYYMCHLAGTMGTLRVHGGPAWHSYEISDEGIYCRRRLALRAGSQRRLRLGNFIARLHHPRMTDPAHGSAILSALYLARALIPYEYAKRLHDGAPGSLETWLRHAANVARDPFGAFAFAWHLLRDRFLAKRKFPSIIVPSPGNLFSLDFHAEQQPHSASRVRLGDERDALGVPRLHVEWRYTPGDVTTVRTAFAVLAADLAACGAGQLDFDPESVEAEITRHGAYGGHHIGTARMGTDPRCSVVDADCRVHGIRNLFVASSAVFPTSGQANPTLTIIALTLRLGTLLRAEGRSPPRPPPRRASAPPVLRAESTAVTA